MSSIDGNEIQALANHIMKLVSSDDKKCIVFTNVIKKYQHVMEEQFIKSPLFQLVTYSNLDELTHSDIPKISTNFFIIHDFKKSESPLTLLPIMNWIQSTPMLSQYLEHIYICNKDEASDKTSLYVNMKFIFRSFDIRIYSPFVYDCCRNLGELTRVPPRMVTQLLFESVTFPSYAMDKLRGIQYIYYDLLNTSDWSMKLQTHVSSILKSTKRDENELLNNVMFYDELVKFLVWKSDVSLEELNTFYEKKLYESSIRYFQMYFDMYPQRVSSFVDVMGVFPYYFYIPDIYMFDPSYFKWIRAHPPVQIEKTSDSNTFFVNDHVIKPNVMGRALHKVIKDLVDKKQAIARNPVLTSVVFGPFILSHMKHNAKQLLPFMNLSEPLYRTELMSAMNAFLDSDCFSHLPYLSEDMYTGMVSRLTPEDRDELGPGLKKETRDIWFGLLYQYSLYSYSLISDQLQLLHPERKMSETDITEYSRKIKDLLMSKPTTPSTLFHSSDISVDCLVEAFFESTILFTDLQGDKFLTKEEDVISFTTRMRNALYASSNITPVTTRVSINWITPEFVSSMYKHHDIPFTIAQCKELVCPILFELHSILKSGSVQLPLLYRWIHQFSDRGHLLPLETHLIITEPSHKELDVLLAEQVQLRHSDKELSALHQSEIDRIEDALSTELIEEKRLLLVNRINFLDVYTQGTGRLVPTIPVPNDAILSELLSASELSLSDMDLCKRLYELYQQRHELLMSTPQLDTIQARLLKGLMTRTHTISKQYPKLDQLFDQSTVYVLLNSMNQLDLSHLFVFYSMLYNWYVLPNTDMMIVSPKQAHYCREIRDHLVWLHRMGILHETDPLLTIFSDFFTSDDDTLKFHVHKEIDEYQPISLPEWVEHKVIKRELEFKKLAEHTLPENWYKSVSNSKEFSLLVTHYNNLFSVNLSTLSDTDALPLIDTLSKLHQEAIDLRISCTSDNVVQFLWEVQRDIEWISWYVKHASRKQFPSMIEIKCIYWIISFYVYGDFTTTLFSALNVTDSEKLPRAQAEITKLLPKIKHLLQHSEVYFSQPTFRIIVELIIAQCETLLTLE